MRTPYSSGVQRLLQNAQNVSGKYNHRFVHTEYLLLALLKDTNGATELLRSMRRDVVSLRRKCEAKCHRGEHPMEEALKLTTGVQNVLAIAHEQVRALGHKTMDTRHVLIGLILEDEGIGGEILRHEGLTSEAILSAIHSSGSTKTPQLDHESMQPPTLWRRLLGGR